MGERKRRSFPFWGIWFVVLFIGAVNLTFTDPDYRVLGPIFAIVSGFAIWKAWNRYEPEEKP